MNANAMQVGDPIIAIVKVQQVSGPRVVFDTVCRTDDPAAHIVVDGKALALLKL